MNLVVMRADIREIQFTCEQNSRFDNACNNMHRIIKPKHELPIDDPTSARSLPESKTKGSHWPVPGCPRGLSAQGDWYDYKSDRRARDSRRLGFDFGKVKQWRMGDRAVRGRKRHRVGL